MKNSNNHTTIDVMPVRSGRIEMSDY
jgi:hypothetical protein